MSLQSPFGPPATIDTSHPRYTDFLVNEILPSGQVVRLDNLKLPAHKQHGKSGKTETLSSTTVEDLKPDRSEAPRPVPEQVSKPAPEAPLDETPIPTSELALDSATAPVPESVHVSVREPEAASGHSEKAGVTPDDTPSADPAAKWQAYASEPSAIEVRRRHLLWLHLRSLLSSFQVKMKRS